MHNHPVVYPGGAEAYASSSTRRCASSDRDRAAAGRADRIGRLRWSAQTHPGAPFSAVRATTRTSSSSTPTGRPSTSSTMTSRDKALYATYLADFLRAHKPDVVHFQHMLFIGYDAVSHTRRVLPDAPIVYTLHEFLPICHRDGQMLRRTGELCTEASPRRCNECFPDIPPQDFFLRERFVKSHLAARGHVPRPQPVPARALRRLGHPARPHPLRGLRPPPHQLRARTRRARRRPRNRIGFFGQLNYYKGVNVLLEAMALLNERGVDAHLSLHGANLELQPPEFQQRVRRPARRGQRATASNVTMRGQLRPRRPAAADGRRRLGGRPVALVGELAARDPGGVPPRPAGDLQRHRRHGREGHRRRRRPALPRRRPHAASPTCSSGRSTTPGLWDELRAGHAARVQHGRPCREPHRSLRRAAASAGPRRLGTW